MPKPSAAEKDAGLKAAGFEPRVASIIGGPNEDQTNPRRYVGGEQRRVERGKPPTAPRLNDHATVKPVDLMRWLVRLVCPPGGTVLDPFLGSGTTGCAAIMEGARFVGVDLDERYVRMSAARIAEWRPKQASLF